MRVLLSTISVLGLLATHAVAQTSSETAGTAGAQGTNTAQTETSAPDEEVRDRAMRNAEGAGMRDVRILDRVFVLQGVTPQGETVFMIVNPPGALIGVGAPTRAVSDTSGGGQARQTGPDQSDPSNAATARTEEAGAGSGSTSGAPEFQIGEIDPGDPFGDIDTSAVTGIEESEIAEFAGTLTEQNLAEMKERCDVISGDPSTYGNDVTTLCNSFMKWWSDNR